MKIFSKPLRFRYGLRAFLLIVTVLAVWIGIHVRRTEQQRQAVSAIDQYGGWVRYSYQLVNGNFDPNRESWVPASVRRVLGNDFFHSVVEVNLVYSDDSGKRHDNSNVTLAPLEILTDLPNLTGLFLQERQANDANLKHVAGLKHLRKLYIWDACEVSDEGISHLLGMRNLNYVHISESLITDKSLEIFATLPKLEGLSLQFNSFTDSGVQKLHSLKNLRTLWICGKEGQKNDVSDESLEFLLQLPGFDSLGVQNTNVTSDFANQLVAKHPTCSVTQ